MKIGMLAAAALAAAVGTGCATQCECCGSCNGDSPYGSWALTLPYETMNAGHLIIERDSANLLWRWSSPTPTKNMKVEGNTFTVTRDFSVPKGAERVPEKWRAMRVCGTVKGDAAACFVVTVDGNGREVSKRENFTAKRNPPIGPKPDMKAAVYGKSVNLLGGTMADFSLMEKDKENGWTLKDGVLSNRIQRDAAGKSLHKNGNLRTNRADFYDFNLKYDVRVLPECNSGVYLRGIYEIQVLDSYGKPVDMHNMAAYYGRVCPRVAAEKPAGEWQTVDVTLYKRHLTVILNGVNIIDNVPVTGVTGGAMTSDEFVPGPIYIQGDHSDADFRNMILTPIVK